MKHKLHKLREERGATLLMSMVFVLVAVMVSAVIISAALTASHRIHDDYSYEQSYQTVTSAASFMKNAIEGSTVKHSKIKNKSTNVTREDWTFTGEFGKELTDFLKDDAGFPGVFSNPLTFVEKSRSYTVTAENFNDVNVKLTIIYDDVNDKYKLKMECSEEDSYTTSHIATITLDMTRAEGQTDTRTVEGVEEEVTETTYTWKAN